MSQRQLELFLQIMDGKISVNDARREYGLPAIKTSFQFSLGDSVLILCSGETGVIQGRADYLNDENRYEILYKAADGRAVEQWWHESAIAKI